MSACCSTSAAACVTFLSSEKVEHIIHRQGHMPSSHTPLLHAHNAHRHGNSCQLVPVCLPMPITAGQFTFSARESRVPCPRRGHMQDPSSGTKTAFVLFILFSRAGKYSSIRPQLCALYICLHRRVQACLAPCSLPPLRVAHPTLVCPSSTAEMIALTSPESGWLLVFLTMAHSR